MNEQHNDEKVRRFFRELRAGDERSAPSFASTWRAATERGEAMRGRPQWIGAVAVAAVVGALVVAGTVWFYSNRHQPATIEIASVTIWDWQSPTAFLLDTPGSDLWRNSPSLDRSWMQNVSEVSEVNE
jgi:hypothetical protein